MEEEFPGLGYQSVFEASSASALAHVHSVTLQTYEIPYEFTSSTEVDGGNHLLGP